MVYWAFSARFSYQGLPQGRSKCSPPVHSTGGADTSSAAKTCTDNVELIRSTASHLVPGAAAARHASNEKDINMGRRARRTRQRDPRQRAFRQQVGLRPSARPLRFEPLEQRCLLSVSPAWFERVSDQTPLTPENVIEINWGGVILPVAKNEWMVEINDATLQSLDADPVSELEAMFVPFGIQVIGGTGLIGWLGVNAFTSDPAAASALFNSTGMVQDFSPNAVYEPAATFPNDPFFSPLNYDWGLHDTGQNLSLTGPGIPPGVDTTQDNDIDAPEAWDKQTGSASVIVGVLDTGIDFAHPDLAFNIWTNPGEIAGNGIDDDGNGFPDDVHGWDFTTNANAGKGDNIPEDNVGHGTHVSGTIGAVGNNGIGISGVAWNASILPLKILDPLMTTFNGASAINYATDLRQNRGITDLVVTNNSWGSKVPGAPPDPAIVAAVTANEAAGMLFVAAASNQGVDLNSTGTNNFVTPASFPHNNIITVGATNNRDQLASFSNYGASSVDLAAPGVGIYSTWPGGGYQYRNGTSMAAPHVAGTAALLWSFDRTLPYQTVKDCILSTVDVDPNPSFPLTDKVLTGGRLNAAMAVMCVTGQQWIEGTKFDDIDGDGIKQAWEPGLANWPIRLVGIDTLGNPITRTTVTDAAGKYWFVNLPTGTYGVAEGPPPLPDLPTDWVQTTPNPGVIALTAGVPRTGVDFGNFEKVDICGTKFEDLNNNGVRDVGEPGLAGWTIYLDANNDGNFDANEQFRVTMTDDPSTPGVDETGAYCFLNVGPGTFHVREVVQPGWAATLGGDGFEIKAKSGVNPSICECGGARPVFDDPYYEANFKGQIAVITCYTNVPNDPVIGIFNLNDLTPALLGKNANPPLNTSLPTIRSYHPAQWTKARLGDVFGVTFNNLGDILVASSTVYGSSHSAAGGSGSIPPAFGPGGSTAIYKIDRRTGAVSIFAQLPFAAPANPLQTPSLGNLTFDAESEMLYASFFDNGVIYRIDKAGTAAPVWMHTGTSTAPDGNFAPLGNRVWGLAVHDRRLYYGVFGDHRNAPLGAKKPNEIWSFAIDINGNPVAGTKQLVTALPTPITPVSPPANGQPFANPPSDIEFGPTGTMLVAERGMENDYNSWPHESRVLEYVVDNAGNWNLPSLTKFKIGDINVTGVRNQNAAGGVAYDHSPDGRVWGTGDALALGALGNPNGAIYGLQGLPSTGGDYLSSYLIDADGKTGTQDKTEIGDVEIPCPPGVNFGNIRAGSIHGQKWEDVDGDGIKDPDEVGVDGWTILVTSLSAGGGVLGQATQEMDLNSDGIIDPRTEKGLYWFDDVRPGTYSVAEIPKPGWHQTYPSTPINHVVTVVSGQAVENVNFGNNRDTGSIHGFKYLDVDCDGMYNPDVDRPMPDVIIRLFGDVDGDGDNELMLMHTDENGEFWFTDLVPGLYTVSEVPGDYIPTTVTSVSYILEPDVELVAFAGQAMLRPDQREFVIGPELMFGNMAPSSIHGFKYKDVNRNGVYDPMVDLPWEGVWISLSGDTDGDGDNDLLNGMTDENGKFWFTGLHPGSYTVSEIAPHGSVPTTPASVTVNVGKGQELVAFAGQAMLLPGQTEVVVGATLMFGNAVNTGAIRGQKLEEITRIWHNAAGTGGLQDNYVAGNTETTNPSAGLLQFLVNAGVPSSPVTYDSSLNDRHFADTFYGLPSNIRSATVRIGLRSNGGSSANDAINLSVREDSGINIGQPVNAAASQSFAIPPGAVTTIAVPSTMWAAMSARQKLDVHVQDDTGVDFVELCIEFETYVPFDGWTIDLFDSGGKVVSTQQTMSMDADGNGSIDPVTEKGLYWFQGIPAGVYKIRERPGSGNPAYLWQTVSPPNGEYFLSLHAGEVINGLNFVNRNRLQWWEPCWGVDLPDAAIAFGNLVAGFADGFLDTDPQIKTVTFDGLSGIIPEDQFLLSDGMLLENLGSEVGATPEGGVFAEDIDGGDGTVLPDGATVYLKYLNDRDPFTIKFPQPAASVGVFFATGEEGNDDEVEISVYGPDGILLDARDVEVRPYAEPDNEEAFFAVQAGGNLIGRVEIRNKNVVDFGNTLLVGRIFYSRVQNLSALPGDYNSNGTVDAADYVCWRNTLGQTVTTPFSGADGDGDGDVTQNDYIVWRANLGRTLPAPGTGNGNTALTSASAAFLTDEHVETSLDRVATPAALDLALLDWATTQNAYQAAGAKIAPSSQGAAGESAALDRLLILYGQRRRCAAWDDDENGAPEHSRRKSTEVDNLFTKLGEEQIDRGIAPAFFRHAV
jgi:subtilisin family serine protease